MSSPTVTLAPHPTSVVPPFRSGPAQWNFISQFLYTLPFSALFFLFCYLNTSVARFRGRPKAPVVMESMREERVQKSVTL